MKRKELTIQEVAEKAGVSIATVSRIINNKGSVKKQTRDHVIEIMEQTNYHPRSVSALADVRSHNILVCVPDFCNPFNSPVIDGIQKAAHNNNYDVLFLQSKDYYTQPSDFTEVLKETSVAGIIILSSVTTSDEKFFNKLSFKCPIVMCSEYDESYGISYVSINDVKASKEAVEYLISTGCRKIGLMNSLRKFKYARHRERGYKQALNENELDYDDMWIAHISSVNYSLSYAAALNILQQKNRPDAMFCCSDVYGIAVVNAAKTLGLYVPEDLSVIGFDNVDIAKMSDPPLTTVSQPAMDLGLQACDLLIEKIQDSNIPDKQIILNTELVVRGTTKLSPLKRQAMEPREV